jgi:hypothetical protein
VQLTTDGHKVYLEAVEGAFGSAIDYAMLVKMYEGDSGKAAPPSAATTPPCAREAASRSSPALRTRRISPRALWSVQT